MVRRIAAPAAVDTAAPNAAAVSPLEALAAQADTIATPAEPGAEPGAIEEPKATAVSNAAALCALLEMLGSLSASRMVLDPPLQSLAHHLSRDKVPALVGPWCDVLDHYGITLGDHLGHPVAVAVFATGPALWALAADLGAELRARRPKGPPIKTAERVDGESGD